MIFQKIEKFIHKLSLRLELKVGKLGITPFFIGNHAEDLLFNHFDTSEYLETIGLNAHLVSIEAADTLIIAGTLNLNQFAFIDNFLKNNPNHFHLIVHIEGPLKDLDGCFDHPNLGDLVPIDINYSRFPIIPSEIFDEIRIFQQKRAL